MIDVFFVKDEDPDGGHYSVHLEPPLASDERVTVSEIRQGTFPEDVIEKIFSGEMKPHETWHYDTIIIPYWEKAVTWWNRDEGYREVGI